VLCVVAKYRLDCKSAVLSANNVAFHFFRQPCNFVLLCSVDLPMVTHCYSRLLHSVHSAIEHGQYSTSSAVKQRNILRIGESLQAENIF